MDAKELLLKFKGKDTKFDRIDVSNISDENYLGLNKCLKLSAPLLKTSSSKLMTTFMNWVCGTEFAPVAGMVGPSEIMENAYKKTHFKQSEEEQRKLISKLLEYGKTLNLKDAQ
jgi:hypothetical protein